MGQSCRLGPPLQAGLADATAEAKSTLRPGKGQAHSRGCWGLQQAQELLVVTKQVGLHPLHDGGSRCPFLQPLESSQRRKLNMVAPGLIPLPPLPHSCLKDRTFCTGSSPCPWGLGWGVFPSSPLRSLHPGSHSVSVITSSTSSVFSAT